MKKIINTFLILSVLAVAFLFSNVLKSAEKFTNTSLKGIITDQATGLPIEMVSVGIQSLSLVAESRSDGTYELENIPLGKFDIYFTKKGYVPFTKKSQLLGMNKNELNITLTQLIPVDISVKQDVLSPPNIMGPEDEEVGYSLDAEPIKELSVVSINGKSSGKRNKRGKVQSYSNLGSNNLYDSYREEQGFNTESYDRIYENNFKESFSNPLSTFSIDVDAASYSNIRRFLSMNQMPPEDAVRIEEMVNYFYYDYKNPVGNHPFSINMELSDCPWNKDNQLVHIGLQGKMLDYVDIQPSNLVFLIDVSGSMNHNLKLPLVKKSIKKLVDGLSSQDRISLVVYAGAAGLVLPSTPASEKKKIYQAIDNLSAGGSTAGGQGIKLAYKVAVDNFIENGNNRVILATDGDFNVGASSDSEMTRLIEEKRKSGVFVTVLGFGMGNYKDSKMEKIANKGNGNYFYIDREAEANKIFGKDLMATLFTIAKDVKIQVEFNPALVESYRLIGYENRKLNNEDFTDDKKDAGELGAGHTVTAIYEIVPVKKNKASLGTDHLDTNEQSLNDFEYKYIESRIKPKSYNSDEMLTLRLRYKDPKGSESQLVESSMSMKGSSLNNSSDNFRWSAAVALFGMMLRKSEHSKDGSFNMVMSLANGAKGSDLEGYREEFINMAGSFIKNTASK